MMSRRWVAFAAVVVVSFTPAACSDDQPPSGTADPAPRVVTEDEASMLADLLPTNARSQGSAVRATIPYGTARFELVGEVDWTNGVGRLTVSPELDGAEAASFAVVFDGRVVFEEVPGLAERLTAQGRGAATWVARPFDAERSPLDVVLSLIATAASPKRDNPVLIRSRGVERVRTDRLGTTAVTLFRDDRITFWVDGTGRMRRMEAELETTASTATIDFSDPGPRTIQTPVETDIVALDVVRDVYDELRRSG